jgi:hypothetical protein
MNARNPRADCGFHAILAIRHKRGEPVRAGRGTGRGSSRVDRLGREAAQARKAIEQQIDDLDPKVLKLAAHLGGATALEHDAARSPSIGRLRQASIVP